MLYRKPARTKAIRGRCTGSSTMTLQHMLMRMRFCMSSEATKSASVKNSDTWWKGGGGGDSEYHVPEEYMGGSGGYIGGVWHTWSVCVVHLDGVWHTAWAFVPKQFDGRWARLPLNQGFRVCGVCECSQSVSSRVQGSGLWF